MLVDIVANGPLDDSEIDTILLTAVQTLVESLGVEKMAAQADRKTLQVVTFRVAISLSCDGLVSLSKHLNVGIVGAELAVSCDASVANFLWKVSLLGKWSAEITANDSLHKWQESLTKVIRGFLWHFGG